MKFLSGTHVFLKNYKWTCCFFGLLYIALYAMDCKKLIYILAEFSIIILPLIIFSKLKLINSLVALLVSIIISLELSYFIIFSEPVNPIILSSIPHTTVVESETALPLLKVFIPLLIVTCLLFFKVTKEFKTLSNKKLLIISLALLLIFSLGTAKMMEKFYRNSDDQRFYKMLFEASTMESIIYFREPIMERFPLLIGNLVYMVGDFLEMRYINANVQHETWPTGISLVKQKPNIPPKIIIVLGESSLPDNYSLYGYPFKTTPNLDQLYKDKKITRVDKAITAIPNTNQAIRLIFSYATTTNLMPFLAHKNIMEMANAANYQSIWLSSVIETGIWGSYAGMIASSSEKFLSPVTVEELRNQQDLSLPPLFQRLYQQGKKQFFVIHLQGSHLPYTYKYDKEDEALTTTPENTDYDRSIHHTDRVLAKIIEIIKQQNEEAILLYFSDHGEIINKGHGFANAPTAQYRVPFIIYQHKNNLDSQQLIDKYRNKNGLLNLMNMSYIMTELMGYEVADELTSQARKDGELVLVSDKPYPFEKLQAGDKAQPATNNPQ